MDYSDSGSASMQNRRDEREIDMRVEKRTESNEPQ